MQWARYVCFLLAPCALAAAADSQVPSSMAPVTKPTTLSNGQPACVQFGDCTTKTGESIKTEMQNSPVTKPAPHSVPDITDKSASAAYASSLAHAAGSKGFAANPQSGNSTPVPPPTTVLTSIATQTKGADGKETPTTVIADAAVRLAAQSLPASLVPLCLALALAIAGGAFAL
ncbi:hypothetical protein MVES1_003444 [Malassezia vespertilionis]|uniref:Uncharacterized protein n=1 Tax=Malassezia vespertilionis TaxID=2020962 RepID=A0A2N1J7G4_9BASI|nr:uncharacterized protein MVES1_003444 [Malassezia vespertilionis]PKI82498.1 hypothetical protein MVES_003682 [Malassezia vespertilionis]WFD08075.1 hypothetical protein MVES1_003444 [Malassezia vespertilionis]